VFFHVDSRRWTAWLMGVASLAMLLTGCARTDTGARTGNVGTADSCPNRDAYCPAEGDGVGAPGRPAISPSGNFRLEVLPADPATGSEDWRFRVVRTGSVVLEPERPAMDGGLGLVVAWATTEPDTVWATRPQLRRWRPGPDGRWDGAPPAPDEAVPDVVRDTQESDS
jgi:hypothetical protein